MSIFTRSIYIVIENSPCDIPHPVGYFWSKEKAENEANERNKDRFYIENGFTYNVKTIKVRL